MFVRPRPAAFAVSLVTHGLILAWVASGPVREKPPSLYDMTVKPRASKLIFYNFRERLPDVAPSRPRASAKPARAERKLASHHIVAGSPKSPRARQFVYTPAPKLEIHADLRSPNILAIHAAPPAPPRKPKLFTPPPERPKPVSAASVPAPPEIAAARNLSGPGNLIGVHPVKAPPRQFAAPRAGRRAVRPAPTLPDAPSLVAAATLAAPSALSGPAPKAPPREFQAPRATARPSPPGAPLPDAPSLPDSPSSAPVTMAIVGLDPALNAPPSARWRARGPVFSRP